jgi:hypothetical protein
MNILQTTVWSVVLREKQVVTETDKHFSTFYTNERYISAFTRSHPLDNTHHSIAPHGLTCISFKTITVILTIHVTTEMKTNFFPKQKKSKVYFSNMHIIKLTIRKFKPCFTITVHTRAMLQWFPLQLMTE